MPDNYNHHVMARMCSDAALQNWRKADWPNGLVSSSLIATSSTASFPSPDATFYDEYNKRLISFEFKPPTETKRGMLTAIGQALAYTQSASFSYVFCPQTIEGFDIQDYLKNLFETKIQGKIPVGLIGYENDSPEQLTMMVDVEKNTICETQISKTSVTNRYWAKHQDMPFQILFYLLDAAYSIGQTDDRLHQIWRHVWLHHILGSGKVTATLEDVDTHISHHYGTPYKPLQKTKMNYKKQVSEGEITASKALAELQEKVNPDLSGDSYANSYKKNFMTFVKHLGLWDDHGRLDSLGFDLHRRGKLYGCHSQVFMDAVKHAILFRGKHLDLLLDLHNFVVDNPFPNMDAAIDGFISHYNSLGKIKWNMGKKKSDQSQNKQFRYEFILWRKLRFMDGDVKKVGFKFNWKEITRICSLDI